MGSRGPQPKQINWDEFEKLMSYDCTMREISAFFDISQDWLNELCIRHYGEKLSELHDKRKLLGRVKLRKIRMAIAERMGPGAATMAIYLSKQMLGERDAPSDPPPSSTSIDKNQIRTFEQFCEKSGYPKPFIKQIEMMHFGIAEGDPRLLLGYRGCGKTDYVTILGVAYDVYLNQTTATNLIISKSRTRNTAMLEAIAKALIDNDVQLEKQNSSCIRVKGLTGKDNSVEVLTIKSSFRGRHPKRIVMDDPVTEEDTSEAMRTLVKKKYDEAYKLCKNIVIIGQPAHAFDLYAHLRPKLKKLEVPHGSIPELDVDLNAMLLAGIDPKSIEMSYHLRVPVDGSMPFSKIKYIDKMPAGDSVCFIDPSDGNNFTALSIIKGYFDGVAIFGKQWQRAWYHCIEDMVPVLKSNGVKKLCFETNKHGGQPIDQLRQVLAPHGIGVVGKYSDSNKHAVILAAGSYAHMIYLSKESDSAYIDHVVQYEYKAKFDDAPDSLARGLEWIGLIKGKK